MLLLSCNNDPCEDVVCGNNQECEEGTCKCRGGLLLDDNGVCSPDNACFNYDCGNGTCIFNIAGEPFCSCDTGYEWDGDDRCNIVIRDRFLGTWMGTHTANGTTSSSYTISITANSEVSEATVTNVMDLACPGSNDEVDMNLIFSDTGHEHSYSCSTFNSSSTSPVYMEVTGNDTLNIDLIISENNGIPTGYYGTYIRQ